jgi:hypothetical protein
MSLEFLKFVGEDILDLVVILALLLLLKHLSVVKLDLNV